MLESGDELSSVALTDTDLQRADCVVVVTAHADYDWEWIAGRCGVVVDTRNAMKRAPEAISQRYPALTLADSHAVIAYYLRHRDELESYLEEREQEAAAVQGRIEAQQGSLAGVRDRILARQAQVSGPGVLRLLSDENTSGDIVRGLMLLLLETCSEQAEWSGLDESNPWLSCRLCNRYKGSQI